MESGDRVALLLSEYEAVDRQDPETLLQPQQTEEEQVGEGGRREGWTGNVVKQTSLFMFFFVCVCGFLEVVCRRGQLDT